MRKLATPRANSPVWREQEKRLADRSGGRLTRGSGSGNQKGDVTGGRTSLDRDELLIEAKSTVHQSLAVKAAWLRKISAEARAVSKTPALAITFADTPLGMEKDWVLLPASVVFNEE